jgi:CIC family chloride channel protein
LKRGSIYTIKLFRRGIEISYGWEQSILQTLKVRDIMSDQVATIPESMQLVDIIDCLKTQDVSYLHVVSESHELIGIISFRDIRPVLQEEALKGLVIARDVATTDIITICPSDSIQLAFQKMGGRGIAQLPVVAEDDRRKIIGTLSKKDVLTAYDKAVFQREIEGY